MMLNLKGPAADMGVIIARFQTPYLTDGHRALIDTVRARHKKFAIVLGIARVIPSRKNPLDYLTRVLMIEELYPGTEIHAIVDLNSDKLWSEKLDKILREVHPHEKIVLYGGRDSFITHYTGRFPTVELDSAFAESGTMAREAAFHKVCLTEDFRRGLCYATANRYPENILCVDVAVIDKQSDGRIKVLLGRKREDGENQWRFFGGHVNPGENAKTAGRREVHEEAGCSIGDMTYIDDTPINDWRYAGTGNTIFTIFFAGTYVQGPVRAGDDIDEVKWFDLTELNESVVVDTHHVLLDKLLRHFKLRGSELHSDETSEFVETKAYEYETNDVGKVYKTPIPASKVDW